MSPEEWMAFLIEERTAVLSTAGLAGFPHLSAMWYLPADDALLMWTYAKSQKALNLRRDQRLGVLVEAGNCYEELRGVLIQGQAVLVADPDECFRFGMALHARYQVAGSQESLQDVEAGVRAQAAKRVLIRVPYEHIVSWDHRKLVGRHASHG
jgi:PPOX class probable F420-dependent enzyme